MDLIVTTCTSPFDAASHRKLCCKTAIRNIEQSYGPWIEGGARGWKDITQAEEVKDDALFPCCFVCEEAGGWLMKSRTFNPIRAIPGCSMEAGVDGSGVSTAD